MNVLPKGQNGITRKTPHIPSPKPQKNDDDGGDNEDKDKDEDKDGGDNKDGKDGNRDKGGHKDVDEGGDGEDSDESGDEDGKDNKQDDEGKQDDERDNEGKQNDENKGSELDDADRDKDDIHDGEDCKKIKCESDTNIVMMLEFMARRDDHGQEELGQIDVSNISTASLKASGSEDQRPVESKKRGCRDEGEIVHSFITKVVECLTIT